MGVTTSYSDEIDYSDLISSALPNISNPFNGIAQRLKSLFGAKQTTPVPRHIPALAERVSVLSRTPSPKTLSWIENERPRHYKFVGATDIKDKNSGKKVQLDIVKLKNGTDDQLKSFSGI